VKFGAYVHSRRKGLPVHRTLLSDLRKLHKAKSYSKIDGLVALAMALGCMSADDLIQPTSPWDDPDFKLAV